MLSQNENNNEIIKSPVHIAIIPDGNRRWAKNKGLPVKAGHKEGSEVFRRIVRHAGKMGIKYVSFYAFSTENWKRSRMEVDALMDLLLGFLKNSQKELGKDKDKIKICVTGSREGLSDELKKEIKRVEDETKENKDIIVNICINYGSRDEMCECVKTLCKKVKNNELKIDDITTKVVSEHLYTNALPDPDLLIRTSGEQRISNFMLWQMAYTEFYFTEKYWPDFTEKDLEIAVNEYTKRQRRFGAN